MPASDQDRVRLWLDRAQIPIGVAGVILGVYWITKGQPVIGIVVMALAVCAAILAIRRLRQAR